jgi:hypothetical protein
MQPLIDIVKPLSKPIDLHWTIPKALKIAALKPFEHI